MKTINRIHMQSTLYFSANYEKKTHTHWIKKEKTEKKKAPAKEAICNWGQKKMCRCFFVTMKRNATNRRKCQPQLKSLQLNDIYLLETQARVFTVHCSHFVHVEPKRDMKMGEKERATKRERENNRNKRNTNEIETYNCFFLSFWKIKFTCGSMVAEFFSIFKLISTEWTVNVRRRC